MSPTNWGHFQDRNGNCNVVFKGEGGGGGGGTRRTTPPEYPETNSRGREEKEEAQRTYGVDAET